MNNLVVESFYSHRESDVIQMNTNSIQMSLDGLNSGHNKPFKRTSSYRPYKFPQKSIEYEEKSNKKIKSNSNKHQKRDKKMIRKHLRRPKVILENNNNHYLATHMWLIKRMKMVEIWNKRLPEFHRQRGIKAACTTLSSSFLSKNNYHNKEKIQCNLFDESYYDLIEISTDNELNLYKYLNQISDTNFNKKKSIPTLLKEYQEINIHLYQRNGILLGPGIIRLLNHQPHQSNESNKSDKDYTRKCWLWIHPCITQDLMIELNAIRNNNDTKMIVNQIKGMSRFQISGQNALSILTKVIVPDNNNNINNNHDHDKASRFLKSAVNCEIVDFDSIWPIGYSIHLHAPDPRNKPNEIQIKNTSTTSSIESSSLKSIIQSNLHISNESLYDVSIRETAKMRWKPDHVINTKRRLKRFLRLHPDITNNNNNNNNIEDDNNNNDDDDENNNYEALLPLPIIITRVATTNKMLDNETSNHLHVAGKWRDEYVVILPTIWSRALWVALIAKGAQALGLKEQEMLSVFKGKLNYPRDYPDTAAGQEYWKSYIEYETEKDLKRSTQKRLGVIKPYWQDTKNIEDDNKMNVDDDESIPTIKILRKLEVIKSINEVPTVIFKGFGSKRRNQLLQNQQDKLIELNDKNFEGLVIIRLRPVGRGIPIRGSELYLPTLNDLEMINNNKHWNGIEINEKNEKRDHIGMVLDGLNCVGMSGGNVATALIEVSAIKTIKTIKSLINEKGKKRKIENDDNLNQNNINNQVVMFKNHRSGWLRPAKYTLIL